MRVLKVKEWLSLKKEVEKYKITKEDEEYMAFIDSLCKELNTLHIQKLTIKKNKK